METKSFKMNRLFVLAVALMTISVNAWGGTDVMYPDGGTDFNSNWNKTSRTARAASYANKCALQMMSLNGGTYGEITSKATYSNVSAISINCASSKANTMTVIYSANGTDWTALTATDISKNESSYTDYNLNITSLPSSAVYIGVRASVNSLYLYSITITTCTTPMSNPNVNVAAGNQTVTLTWDAVEHASGYKVSWADGAYEDPTGTRTYTKGGLTNGIEYSWKVKAIGTGSYCDSETSGTATPSATYTVQWDVDGTIVKTDANVTKDATISTPTNPATPASCGTAVFRGWTATQNYSHATDAPSDLFNGTSPAITGNITFYAVFADEE